MDLNLQKFAKLWHLGSLKLELFATVMKIVCSSVVSVYTFQRGDPGRPEEEVLMRTLRDFNIPKIVTDDVPVFMGLIGDLFPALDVPRKRDQDFEKMVKQAALDLHLQPEENFVLKVRINFVFQYLFCTR